MGLTQTSIERQSPSSNAPASPAKPLTLETQRRTLGLLKHLENLHAQRLFYEIYPEQDTIWTGPPLMGGLIETGQTLHSRRKYPKHMEFLGAGKEWRERCAMMANRVGKTFGLGGYEMSCHLTGLYPDWWDEIGGRRFYTPISAWAAGDTYVTCPRIHVHQDQVR